MKNILNIAGYKFVALTELPALKALLIAKCQEQSLKGTILLSPEGINLSLAGTLENVRFFQNFLKMDQRFSDMSFRESTSDFIPFKRMKVKVKKEIITLRKPNVRPAQHRAPSISPQELKNWLDEQRDITLLDTRNDFEVQAGTFHNAVNLHLKDFCEFAEKSEQVTRDKPIVMFCTGGIRCEKAAILLDQKGYKNVYQLDGGILNYFAAVGDAHYDGGCFVFDEREIVDATLKN
jgi:UPF0176 protein